MIHLGALLDAATMRWPQRLALRGADGDLSYGALDSLAGTIAKDLRVAGLKANEPVGVRVSNQGRDLAAFLGIWRAGGIVVPIHRTAIAASADAIVAHTGMRFLVDAAGPDAVQALARPVPPPRAICAGAAFIIFTSGTTGQPKGVVLSHHGFGGKLDAIDSVLPFGEDTRTLLVLQLTFSFGQWVSLLTLTQGGTLVLHDKFEPAQVLRTLVEDRINRIGVIPTMMRAMLPLLRLEKSCRDDAACLFMAGGEPLPAPLGRAFRELIPKLELCDIYGLTETSTSDFILRPEDQDRFPGTIGQPSPGVAFAIHDENGNAVPPGRPGELAIKTPFIMRGYLDAPELTAASFRNGFFRTGDLAEVMPSGAVRLVGRSKELILRAGNKISPVEVERAYLDHPEVAEVLATGLPDERLGEAIHLLVVPLPGRSPSPDALRRWAADRLDKYKIPDAVHLGAAIPLGRTGKADRGALKIRLLEKLGRT